MPTSFDLTDFVAEPFGFTDRWLISWGDAPAQLRTEAFPITSLAPITIYAPWIKLIYQGADADPNADPMVIICPILSNTFSANGRTNPARQGFRDRL